MQKTCDFPGCNHTGTPSSCSLKIKLGVGCRGAVLSVGGDCDLRRRLFESGFCNGAQVEVVRRALLATPSNSASAAITFPFAMNKPNT